MQSEPLQPEQQSAQPEEPNKPKTKNVIKLLLFLALIVIGGVAFYSVGYHPWEHESPTTRELPAFDPSLPKGKESFEASKAAWPGDEQGYWHAKLNGRVRSLYDAMLPHLAARETSLEVGYIRDLIDGAQSMGQEALDAAAGSLAEDVSLTIWAITSDHPEMFWLNTQRFMDTCFSNPSFEGNTVDDQHLVLRGIDYGLTNEQIDQTQAKMDAVVQEALASAPKEGSDYEQALAIYRWLASHVEYAKEVKGLAQNKASAEEQNKASEPYQGADSALVGGISVCSGYSRAYQLLLGKLGIPCTIVYGLGDALDPSSPHAWNLVCLGGRMGYTDTTWSDMEEQRYEDDGSQWSGRLARGAYADIKYFFMTDADMKYDGRVAGRAEDALVGLNIKELLPACNTVIWEDDRYEPGGEGHLRQEPKPEEQQKGASN